LGSSFLFARVAIRRACFLRLVGRFRRLRQTVPNLDVTLMLAGGRWPARIETSSSPVRHHSRSPSRSLVTIVCGFCGIWSCIRPRNFWRAHCSLAAAG
jgi:hypothetical protein